MQEQIETQTNSQSRTQEKVRLGLFAAVLGLLLVVLWLYLNGQLAQILGLEQRIATSEFSGQVLEVRDSSMVLEGGYVVPGRAEFLAEENMETVLVNITSDTELVLFRVTLPTEDEVGEDGVYQASDLKRERSLLSWETFLEQDLSNGVRVVADENIFRKNKFTAQTVELIVPVYPDEETAEL